MDFIEDDLHTIKCVCLKYTVQYVLKNIYVPVTTTTFKSQSAFIFTVKIQNISVIPKSSLLPCTVTFIPLSPMKPLSSLSRYKLVSFVLEFHINGITFFCISKKFSKVKLHLAFFSHYIFENHTCFCVSLSRNFLSLSSSSWY